MFEVIGETLGFAIAKLVTAGPAALPGLSTMPVWRTVLAPEASRQLTSTVTRL